MSEDRAKLSSKARNALSDSDFAYIDEKGVRHFPIHDKAHVTAALRLGPRSPMWSKAKGKVMAAAKKFGVGTDSDATGRSLESLYPEVRFIADRPELRAAEGDGQRHIVGYAAVFKSTSRRLGNFHEQVMPGAFDAALRSIEDRTSHDIPLNVVCRYNHKDDMVLGTTLAGTLKLAVDDRGLKYDVIPPECRADVMEYVDRGDVRYSSFAFRVAERGVDDTWGESEFGLPLRQLHKVELVDVAPVLDPAYFATNASGRGMNGAVESLADWVGADPNEVRSMLEAGQASKFFRKTRRTGTQVIPKPEESETRVLDDPAVAVRDYSPEAEADEWTPADERIAPDNDEVRAAMKNLAHEKLCKQWTDGSPCVRPAGHDADGKTGDPDGHAPLCWSHKSGLPCHMPQGHDGEHEPLNVKTRDAGEGESPEEERQADEPKGLSGPQALAKILASKRNLTELPE